MKTTVAYYLLLLYTLAMCKPVLPLIQDEIAHFFWNSEHIATVHHHYGNHHAVEESASATHDEENHEAPKSSKISEPVSIHIITQGPAVVFHFLTTKFTYGKRVYEEASSPLDKHYPPPKFC